MRKYHPSLRAAGATIATVAVWLAAGPGVAAGGPVPREHATAVASARVIAPFRVSIVGRVAAGRSNYERVTQIAVTGLNESETFTAACVRCGGAKLGGLRASGNRDFLAPHNLFVSASTRLLVFVSASGMIGRYKEYTLRPRLRAHRLIQQGCLAIADAVPVSCEGPGIASQVGPVNTVLRPEPSCPRSPCLAVSRVTGFQARTVASGSPSSASEGGYLVAWEITLARPTSSQISFFEVNEGGPAEAGIAVLRPEGGLAYKLVAQSPPSRLQPYFGTSVEFPLAAPIPVEAGDVIALTVPTWAPALSLGYGDAFTWRGSRPANACTTTSSQADQIQAGSLVEYFCLYQTAVLTYGATISPTP